MIRKLVLTKDEINASLREDNWDEAGIKKFWTLLENSNAAWKTNKSMPVSFIINRFAATVILMAEGKI